MATTINAGRVAMVPKGAWSSSTAYERLDVVELNGSSYVAKLDNTNQNPATATTYWQLLASGGGGVGGGDYYICAVSVANDSATALGYMHNGDAVTASAWRTALLDYIAAPTDNATFIAVDTTHGRFFGLSVKPGNTIGNPVKFVCVHDGTIRELTIKQADNDVVWDYVTYPIQETLVSGTNIKTINGTSVLGSGNLTTGIVINLTATATQGEYTPDTTYADAASAVQSGRLVVVRAEVSPNVYITLPMTETDLYGAGQALYGNSIVPNDDSGLGITGYAAFWLPNYASVYLSEMTYGEADPTVPSHVKSITQANITAWGNKADKVVTASTIPAGGALPNVCYNLGTTDSVSITLAAGESGVANVWMFTFTAQTTACSVTLPSGMKLANEYSWNFAADRYFEITIMNNVAVVVYCDPTSNS